MYEDDDDEFEKPDVFMVDTDDIREVAESIMLQGIRYSGACSCSYTIERQRRMILDLRREIRDLENRLSRKGGVQRD